MTSILEGRRELYEKIKNYKPPEWENCTCDHKHCESCEYTMKEKKKETMLPYWAELNDYMKRILGINVDWFSNSLKWDRPFERNLNSPKDKERMNSSISENHYHIVFIDYGIRIIMNKNIISKIGILNSILLENNGCDKPILLEYLDMAHNEVFKGPYLYITKLPMNSLLFNKPPEDYKIELLRADIDSNMQEKGYYKFENIEESLINEQWYT